MMLIIVQDEKIQTVCALTENKVENVRIYKKCI